MAARRRGMVVDRRRRRPSPERTRAIDKFLEYWDQKHRKA
jgi:ribosomal protein L13E